MTPTAARPRLARPLGRHLHGVSAAILAVVALAAVAFVALPLQLPVRVALAHIVLTSLHATGAVLCFMSARRAGRRAAPWILFGVGLALVGIGEAWSGVTDALHVTGRFPTPPYFLFLLFHVAFAAGVVLALRPARVREFALEVGLDTLLLLLLANVLLLRFVLPPVQASSAWMGRWELTWMLAGHLLALLSACFGALLVVWREPVVPPSTAAALALSTTLNFAASVLQAMGFNPDPAHPGNPFTLLWVLVWALAARGALGGLEPAPAPSGRADPPLPALMRQGMVATVVLVLGAAAMGLLRPSFAWGGMRITIVLATLALVARWLVARRVAQREAEDRRALAQTRALVEVSNALATSTQLAPALDVVVEWTQRLLHGSGAAIVLLAPDGNATVPAATGSLAGCRGKTLREGHVLAGWLEQRGKPGPRSTGDVASIPGGTGLELGGGTPVGAAPVCLHGAMAGVLMVALDETLAPGELDLIAALAEQAAVALEGHRLLEDAREAEQGRFQSEKLTTVGRLAGGIAHEINNPLAAIQSAAELLLDDAPAEGEDRRLLTLVRSEARRAGVIVRNLLELVRPHEARVEAVDLVEIVEDTLRLRAYTHGLQNITVVRDLEPVPPVRGDPDRLRQVFLNLIVNAEQAQGDQPQGRITLRTRPRGDQVEIAIADDGPGIAAENLPRVFEPFFTTKQVGQGTGLGLSVTYGIVRDLGGSIRASNRSEGGATFTLLLPAADLAEVPAPASAPAVAPAPGAAAPASVLLVDDEVAIREVGARSLRRAGFAVETVDSGEAALELLQRQRFDVILTDIRMPGIGGEGLYRRLEELCIPVLDRFIFISGDIVAEATTRFLASTGQPYLMKPFELRELVALVRSVSERARQPSPAGAS